MRIRFDYNWYDDDKTVMCYSAHDNWTWKDYHSVVRASLYTIQSQPHPVHTLIDFTTGARERFPSGMGAHAQTFGKKLAPNLSGNAVVVGVPPEVLRKLGIAESCILQTTDGEAHFIENKDNAKTIFEGWG